MTITVLVTTYGRRPYLARCLESLIAQTRVPDEVVVVTREGDEASEAYVQDLLHSKPLPFVLQHARVREPGVLAANGAGLALVTGDILSFLDDDATARPDWVARVERWFAENPELGALGGRDLQHTARGVRDEPAAEAGRIRWYGKVLGNHHCRVEGAHPAEILKGCNMSFRRALVHEFDEGILGHAHYYELDLCFAVRRAGYGIVYDGETIVDHFVEAPRYLAASSVPRDPEWFFYMHHNRVYVMMKNLPAFRRGVFLIYTFASDALTSLGRWVLRHPDGDPRIVKAMFSGKLEGLRRYRARSRPAGFQGGRGAA